jgi:predicted oxidoreductase
MQEAPIIVGTMRLGQWGLHFNTQQWLEFIEGCLAAGLHEFDHADIYGGYTTEADFGRALKEKPSLRTQMHITTKCGILYPSENRPEIKLKSYDSSKKHIIASAENSLRDLQTDYIDQLLLHRPDFLMDPDEVAEAFEELQGAGKVREFGISNFKPSQLSLLHDYLPLASHQIQISLLHLAPFTDGTLDQCLAREIKPTAWSPLGGSGFFTDPHEPRHKRIRETATAIGRKYDASFDQIMLAFLAKHPTGIRPVMGTSKIERLRSAAAAMQIKISRAEWYQLWQAATGERVA